MFRAVVSKRPAVAVGSKGYRKQALGVYLISADGVEDDFPTKIEVMRGPDEKDYAAGEYTIHPASFVVRADDFGSGQLVVGRMSLTPKADRLSKVG